MCTHYISICYGLCLKKRAGFDTVYDVWSCVQVTPEEFVETLKLMEHRYGAKEFVTSKDTKRLAPGTYYLTEVDSMYRRFYSKKPTDDSNTAKVNGKLANGH